MSGQHRMRAHAAPTVRLSPARHRPRRPTVLVRGTALAALLLALTSAGVGATAVESAQHTKPLPAAAAAPTPSLPAAALDVPAPDQVTPDPAVAPPPVAVAHPHQPRASVGPLLTALATPVPTVGALSAPVADTTPAPAASPAPSAVAELAPSAVEQPPAAPAPVVVQRPAHAPTRRFWARQWPAADQFGPEYPSGSGDHYSQHHSRRSHRGGDR